MCYFGAYSGHLLYHVLSHSKISIRFDDMSVILTNDDGIDAPGIQALWKAVNGKAIFIAPKQEWSGCGHRVTNNAPIHVEKRSQFAYAVGGTPADCVRLAISHLCPDVNLVISGINGGGNLGVDSYISGTIAAAREAAIHGIPAIAISHYVKKPLAINWDLATIWAGEVIDKLLSMPWEQGSFWSVNFPHLETGSPEPQVIFCQPSTNPLPIQYRREEDNFYYIGEYDKRDRTPGCDVDVCFSGNIAVTKWRF